MFLRKLLPVVATMAMTASAVADENYSNINLGPTFFTFKGKEKDAEGTTEQKGLYCGMRAELEYANPEGIYGGFVGVYAPGAQTAYHSFAADDTSSGMKASTYLWQVEGRVGTHYKPVTNASIVPFVALGMYHVDSTIKVKIPSTTRENESTEVMEWGYVAVGASGSYPVSDILDIGFGAKILRHFYSSHESIVNKEVKDLGDDAQWGYELMLPFKLRAGKESAWNFQAEPFFLKIDTEKAVGVFGARFSVQRAF